MSPPLPLSSKSSPTTFYHPIQQDSHTLISALPLSLPVPASPSMASPRFSRVPAPLPPRLSSSSLSIPLTAASPTNKSQRKVSSVPQVTASTICPNFSSFTIDSDDDSDEEPPSSVENHRTPPQLVNPHLSRFHTSSFHARHPMIHAQQASHQYQPPSVNGMFIPDSPSNADESDRESAYDDQLDSDDDPEFVEEDESYTADERTTVSTPEHAQFCQSRSQPVPIPGAQSRVPTLVDSTLAHTFDANYAVSGGPFDPCALSFLPPHIRRRALAPHTGVADSSASLLVGRPESSRRHSIAFDERVFY